MTRHFLTVTALSPDELLGLLDLADLLKADRAPRDDLRGRSIGLLFEQPSTRTRVSFEVGIAELGAHPVVLSSRELQLGRGETIEDTARVLSRYLHAIVIRTLDHQTVERLAGAASVPVINALTAFSHPCQALADLQTIREYKGRLAGVRLTHLGDGNNVAHALLQAGAMAGMHVTIASPSGYEPIAQAVEAARRDAALGGTVTVTDDPEAACADADVLSTDVWASMGQDEEAEARRLLFRPYQLGAPLLRRARPDAIVLHCLPAHRGEEITAEVIDGPQSVVWAQAENRLHAQKALLLLLLGVGIPARPAEVLS
jgi:ornithine carbamoyltransferase